MEVIEKKIKRFVFSKIREDVALDVSKSNIVSVKHRSKRGSVALAEFWLGVFQHQNNYPMPKYPYKELYDKQGTNKNILKVDTVTLTVFMTTGTLMIQGNDVLDWFSRHFQSIMDHYDSPVQEQHPKTEAFKQYTESSKRMEDETALRKANEDAIQNAFEDKAIEILREKENIVPVTVTEETIGVVIENGCNSNAVIETDDVVDDLADLSIDRWPPSTVDKQLMKLRTGYVMDGSTYIYKLWKSLLLRWFSDPDCKVYLVTPFLDASRLADICQVVLQHKCQANLEAFYVRQQCDREKKIHEVKQDALKQFRDAEDQESIEDKIFSNIIFPMKRFHAKFMAGVKDGVAHVLITSANFHGDHFECSNMETVKYETMSEDMFLQGFLGPINSSVTVHK